jgi:predicted transcriptional regulator
MKIRDLVNKHEKIVNPFSSINSIEEDLIRESYLVIKEDERFVGILTMADVLASGHNLVIDCYSEKPLVNSDEDAENVMNQMLLKKFSVVPVVDIENKYIGCAHVNTILSQIWEITKQQVSINWIDVTDPSQTETGKRVFSSELFHNTKNPIQVILSAADMLLSDASTFQSKMLLKSIESNARLLDALITKLYTVHFEEKGDRL